MVLYCMSFRLVLEVMENIFLQTFVQKSGVGGSTRSFSHFALGSVTEEVEEAIIL